MTSLGHVSENRPIIGQSVVVNLVIFERDLGMTASSK
jgi:hypothetical protein